MEMKTVFKVVHENPRTGRYWSAWLGGAHGVEYHVGEEMRFPACAPCFVFTEEMAARRFANGCSLLEPSTSSRWHVFKSETPEFQQVTNIVKPAPLCVHEFLKWVEINPRSSFENALHDYLAVKRLPLEHSAPAHSALTTEITLIQPICTRLN